MPSSWLLALSRNLVSNRNWLIVLKVGVINPLIKAVQLMLDTAWVTSVPRRLIPAINHELWRATAI